MAIGPAGAASTPITSQRASVSPLEFSFQVQRPETVRAHGSPIRWCLRQTTRHRRTHGPVRTSYTGGARGDHADAARGQEPGRHRKGDGQGPVGHQQGDAQELVPGRRGTLLPGIGRATLLRGAQALLRTSQDPRRRGARRARHAADRAGALVARADRRQDRGRTSGPVGVRVDHLPGRQRRQARPARAGAHQTGHQGAPAPQGQAAAPEGRARGETRQDPRDQAHIGTCGRGRAARAWATGRATPWSAGGPARAWSRSWTA